MVLIILSWIMLTLLMASVAIVGGKYFGKGVPIALMACFLVIGNVFSTKLVMFGSFVVPGGVLVFSVTFLITDLLSELWGKRAAKIAVWTGLGASVFFVLSLIIVIEWPIAPFMADYQDVFKQVLGLSPRIAIASVIAYIVSQNHDVWAYHFWKKKTKGKHLWLRNNLSTIVSQAIDSVIFAMIAFYGIVPVFPVIIGNYVVKVIIAFVDTPFAYLIKWVTGPVYVKKKKVAGYHTVA
jgi:queuosine precursor transporter